jgi:integrase
VAKVDKSWTSKGLDPNEVLDKIKAIDIYVAAQVDLILHFGLRRKESIMLQPHLAVVPSSSVNALREVARDDLPVLKVDRGTKGGRLRYVPIDSTARRAAIERAKAMAPQPDATLTRPEHSLLQTINRFEYVMTKVGITKKEMAVTIHGLRHEYANDVYFDLTGTNSPVRGGSNPDPELDLAARRQVAEQLGHARPRITGAYTGTTGSVVVPAEQELP